MKNTLQLNTAPLVVLPSAMNMDEVSAHFDTLVDSALESPEDWGDRMKSAEVILSAHLRVFESECRLKHARNHADTIISDAERLVISKEFAEGRARNRIAHVVTAAIASAVAAGTARKVRDTLIAKISDAESESADIAASISEMTKLSPEKIVLKGKLEDELSAIEEVYNDGGSTEEILNALTNLKKRGIFLGTETERGCQNRKNYIESQISELEEEAESLEIDASGALADARRRVSELSGLAQQWRAELGIAVSDAETTDSNFDTSIFECRIEMESIVRCYELDCETLATGQAGRLSNTAGAF